MDEIRINVPEGMEIDRENSTFECIKFKKKIDFTPKKGDFIYITTTGNYWYLCIFDHMDGRDDALSELRVFVNNMNITE